MNLWNNVDKVVKEKRTTLAIVSEKAGISYDTVRNWRTRHIYPRIDEAIKFAEVLNVSLEKLFFDKDINIGTEVIERLRKAECMISSIKRLLEDKEDPC